MDNPFLEIGARDSGYASQGGFHTEFTDLQNAFCIELPFATRFQDFLVAGAFALLHQPRPQPPSQRVKPKAGFNHHVYRSGKIVAAAYVPQFVGEDRFQVASSRRAEILSGHTKTGRTMPKIPGSIEARDNRISVGFRMPSICSSRRSASTSRPSRSGVASRMAAEIRRQRRSHTKTTIRNPQSHTARRAGSRWMRLARTVEGVAGETIGVVCCMKGWPTSFITKEKPPFAPAFETRIVRKEKPTEFSRLRKEGWTTYFRFNGFPWRRACWHIVSNIRDPNCAFQLPPKKENRLAKSEKLKRMRGTSPSETDEEGNTGQFRPLLSPIPPTRRRGSTR